MRVGTGFDIHRLKKGGPLLLGGVEIPAPVHAEGHSDGDALTHAVVDAVLGAAGLGDIGQHYPNTDLTFRGACSVDVFLRDTARKVREAGFAVASVDSTLILEHPKLGQFRVKIRDRLAEALGIPYERINVKAKTCEELGPVGRGQAVAAQAVALLVPANGKPRKKR